VVMHVVVVVVCVCVFDLAMAVRKKSYVCMMSKQQLTCTVYYLSTGHWSLKGLEKKF